MFIDRALAARGAELLGHGDFAAVISDPSDPTRVLKFGLSTADAWPAWARFSREYQSTHTPVIHNFRWLANEAGHRIMYVAEVERLQPWDGTEHAELRGLLGSSKLRADAGELADAVGLIDFGLACFLYQVRRAFPFGTHDMGPSNWMIRPSTGGLVLNDPLSYRANVGDTKGITL